ncbi:helicase C-terminal domain-containing protein [Curtobacterium sp. MCBD17_040]|uniref:ATP-dependent DNA helicase n=1 Tax=Curtobacterium sp. MCBD17_040 TaxID=2175674 RepID=UPI000DA89EAA|nr:helicase C-terminal domain-containing protein [Curtobacterium sp. MCBD17_040]WIB65548.1 helicase C-terminal domain-containing protein [Curtobacterium sp. MCBD17_040]
MAGIAPTGSGKSLAALSVAAVGAARYGERWLVSTESLSLQQQYVNKDAPTVVQATKEVLGADLGVAVLKGWSNYVCAAKTMNVVRKLGITNGQGGLSDTANRIDRAHLKDTVFADGRVHDSTTLRPLLAWAVRQHETPDTAGDKHSYQGEMSDLAWSAVSVSTQECVGEAACPLAAICRPRIAREKVAEADIVITNHAMLAVQAASNTPVVIGNQKLGAFHGIIVDEAHALPGIVRSQGQSAISASRLQGIINRVREAGGEGNPTVDKWVADGKQVIDYVAHEIASGQQSSDDGRIPQTVDPLENTGDVLTAWLKSGSQHAQAVADKSDMSSVIASKRAAAAIDQMVRTVDSVRQHWAGVARWWENDGDGRGAGGAGLQSAPVQVAGMMDRNLWHDASTPPADDDDSSDQQKPASDGEEPAVVEPRPLTVATLSATLQQGFVRDAGLKTQVKSYPSPFTDAYARSLLYVPKVTDDRDADAIGATRYGKVKFDVRRHAEWAARGMAKLIELNGGSALTLAATSTNGRQYAEHFRKQARGRFNVYSQWDGEAASVIVDRWKHDKHGVLVGTKSLMTGVDAPGETCTLVQVDRAPRAASNPVDDARVDYLMETAGYDRWTADRLVYVADAAILLEQALGRLIRSGSDWGLAAVWDPRMINAGPFRYQTPTRNSYQEAMRWFPIKTTSLDDAKAYLRNRGHVG